MYIIDEFYIINNIKMINKNKLLVSINDIINNIYSENNSHIKHNDNKLKAIKKYFKNNSFISNIIDNINIILTIVNDNLLLEDYYDVCYLLLYISYIFICKSKKISINHYITNSLFNNYDKNDYKSVVLFKSNVYDILDFVLIFDFSLTKLLPTYDMCNEIFYNFKQRLLCFHDNEPNLFLRLDNSRHIKKKVEESCYLHKDIYSNEMIISIFKEYYQNTHVLSNLNVFNNTVEIGSLKYIISNPLYIAYNNEIKDIDKCIAKLLSIKIIEETNKINEEVVIYKTKSKTYICIRYAYIQAFHLFDLESGNIKISRNITTGKHFRLL